MTELLASTKFKTKTSSQILAASLDFCRMHGYAVAVWRKPDAESIHLTVDFSKAVTRTHKPLDNPEAGFVFAPYDQTKPAYKIATDLHIDLSQNKITTRQDYEVNNQTSELLKYIAAHTSPKPAPQTYHTKTNSREKADFMQLVSDGVAAIKEGALQKVVPARARTLAMENNFDTTSYYLRLANAYPNAFVSLVYTPDTGLWMGATPELLISVNKDSIFKTVALAATQKHNPDKPLSEVAWTQKEIEEQAFVSRYIINCLKKIRLREFEEAGPKTILAGNLIHLKTTITVDMQATNFPDLGAIMLDLLHPTSAVCGMPLAPALKFLKDHEGFDRGFYSGYLGPVNFQEETELFVNLRCMKLDLAENKLTVYAGAGVTEDSTPEKEWQETTIKMNTLLNIIQ